MVEKGARGPGLKNVRDVQFVVSGGVVQDVPLDDVNPWTLGHYVEGIGGQNVRGKKTFGLYVPDSEDEEPDEQVYRV